MCIAFPAKVFKIEENNMALVEIEGTVKRVSLDLLDGEVSLGDYVISHAGFAIHLVDKDAAEERLELLRELISIECGDEQESP
ncbi:MAG: HypC/HybG/HupF family hydrogenase formation chaperone [bacterium]